MDLSLPGHEIAIQPFRACDQAAARALILVGLAEHWGFLDPTLNPDLEDIAASFAGGVFLLAWDGAQLVGTGGLLPVSAGTLQLVRMSVAKSYRRRGIGRCLLEQLLTAARAGGCKRVILETTHTWDEVIRFYLDCGFRVMHREGEDLYFELCMSSNE